MKIFADAAGNGPLALTAEHDEANGFAVETSIRSDGEGARDGTIEALGAHGESLAAAHFHFAPGRTANHSAAHILPLEMRNETRRIAVGGLNSAGAVRLLGASARRRAVGLVSSSNMENEQPLLSSLSILRARLFHPDTDVYPELFIVKLRLRLFLGNKRDPRYRSRPQTPLISMQGCSLGISL